jgi:hypothetical protein
MKKLLILLLFLFTVKGYAQKCEVKKDPFNGNEVIEYDFGKKAVKFRIEDEKIYLEMRFSYRGELNVNVPKGTDFHIKLEDETVLNLKVNADAPPLSRIVGDYIVTLYMYEFEISKEELAQLAASDAEMIRYPDPNGGSLDFKLTGGNRRIKKHLLAGSSCILENLKS